MTCFCKNSPLGSDERRICKNENSISYNGRYSGMHRNSHGGNAGRSAYQEFRLRRQRDDGRYREFSGRNQCGNVIGVASYYRPWNVLDQRAIGDFVADDDVGGGS
jgi:hypothetical protein